MTSPRIMSPDLAFSSMLKQAQGPATHAKGTISVTEAKKALTGLADHPHADAGDRARIVRGFLDGKEGKALSPKAREALVDFVKGQGLEAGGQRAGELKASALKEAKAATGDLDKARDTVNALLNKGMVGKGELATVTKALDGALKNIADARKNLGGLLQVADHSAKLADTELKGAGGEIAQARKDIANIVARAKSGVVTKAQLTEVREWLAEPRGELLDAQRALGASGASVSAKYPSDLEDGGFNGGGMGGGEMMTTRKFPSDNEDGAEAGGGGLVMHTMKAPSDNEDGGGVPLVDLPKPDAKPEVKQARVDEMRKTFNDAVKGGKVQWHNSMPLGQRFETAPISRERHPDGYQFDALIPTGALTPTAAQKDPNAVDSFWIKRTGGIAGLTQYAGPFSVK